jgi:hypothetical protein
MASDRIDRPMAGVVLGMLAPLLGFFAYGLLYVHVIRPHLTLDYFIHELFLGTRRYQAPVLSLSLIADLPLFLWLDRRGAARAMRGVLIAMFLYGIAIVVLWV